MVAISTSLKTRGAILLELGQELKGTCCRNLDTKTKDVIPKPMDKN